MTTMAPPLTNNNGAVAGTKSKMSKSLTFHDIMLDHDNQITPIFIGEADEEDYEDDVCEVECVEQGRINGSIPLMTENGAVTTTGIALKTSNPYTIQRQRHSSDNSSIIDTGNKIHTEELSSKQCNEMNKYCQNIVAHGCCPHNNSLKQFNGNSSATNNFYHQQNQPNYRCHNSVGANCSILDSNKVEPTVKSNNNTGQINHVKFSQSSYSIGNKPSCSTDTVGKLINDKSNKKSKNSLIKTISGHNECNKLSKKPETTNGIFVSMKKSLMKNSVSEMCDIGASSSLSMKRTTTLFNPKDRASGPLTISEGYDDDGEQGKEDEDEKEFDDSQMTKRGGSTRSTASGVNRRGLPFNVPFSTWLQLFLQRRRSRNAHSASARNRYPPASMMRNSVSLFVHESSALGSDGESLEVSPCTSDQMSTSSLYPNANDERCYVPNVKMRQKPQNRQWSEQDIQKRLSLPADIKLPQTVIDKLNRTPTLNVPLTRKSRRASLSEIGFGKLETYKKFFNLGEGTYATVYFGKSLLTGKSVALKEIRLEHEEGAPCTAIREVSLLRNLRHANVVTLHDVIYTERVLTLVFEYVQYDLREYMEKVDEIYVNNVKLFLMQLLRGLAYCHKRRILHRDLKPQNLLINHCGELKLADFGLARAQSVPTKTYSNEVVTLWYRPPDVLLGSTDYSTHIDMWGVGCILYEMLMHKAMFPGSTTDEQLNLIFRRLGTPTKETCPSLFTLTQAYRLKGYARFSPKSLIHTPRVNADRADILHKLLRYDGTKRISAEEAMRHKILEFFPASIFELADTESVLSLPKIYYVREQSWKSGGHMRLLMDK